MTKEDQSPGWLDREITAKGKFTWKKCSKGHLNSPNAKVCWKCGEVLK